MRYLISVFLLFALVFGFGVNVYALPSYGNDCTACHGDTIPGSNTDTDTADQASDTATDTADQASDTATDTADTDTDTADQTSATDTDTADQTTDTDTDTADQAGDTDTDTADQASDADSDSGCDWNFPLDFKKRCTRDGSCEDGTLSVIGHCFPITAGGIKILSFPEGEFVPSMVTDGSWEAFATAKSGRFAGRLKSELCGLCPPKMIGDDLTPAILSGGTHLIVFVADNEPAITDNINLSDIGPEDLVAYTTVVVDGKSYLKIKNSRLEWIPFQ